MLRAYKINIKKGHKLYNYFDEICLKSKNLYNTTNFFIRQALTGSIKDEKDLTPNEKYVLDLINNNIDKANQIKIKQSSKKGEEVKLFKRIDKDNRLLSYTLLDAIFKITKNEDYYALPSHSNQGIMKQVFDDWSGFFASMKSFKTSSSKYTGMPKIPNYAKKNSRKTSFFTNQTCKIKDDKYLRFPKTKLQLNIGKLGILGKLKQVRVKPYKNYFEVEVVLETPFKSPELKTSEPTKIMGIDLGIDNFATISNNIDKPPIIVKGKVLKSINQFYNKERACYYSILRQGKNPKEGEFTSKRLEKLDSKRHFKVKDFIHKVSFNIIKYAKTWDIDTIVIGKNDDFKDNIKLRKTTKLTFTKSLRNAPTSKQSESGGL